MCIDELQNELDKAFAILHDMPVSGYNVDRMMIVRDHLRNAYHLAKNIKTTQEQACYTAADAVDRAVKEAVNNG